MNKKAVVIGCGPAGVLTAHACHLHGLQTTVVSPLVAMSKQYGAQYVHSKIDDVDHESFFLHYEYHGREDNYRKKIYGDKVPVNGTSWRRFRGITEAWPIYDIYQELFSRYRQSMKTLKVDPKNIWDLVDTYDYVFNTAPLDSLAPMGEYRVEYVWVVSSRAEKDVNENEIHYYGDERPAYRSSQIAGFRSIEFPEKAYDRIPWRLRRKAVKVAKPLDCLVELPGVYRLGRYGKWQKGVLVDQAFHETMNILEKRLAWESTLPRQK